VSRDLLDELHAERRREERQIMGCAWAGAIFVLVLVALVFVGCPGAVSYGISRGCAAGSEIGR
jgi:hypothetical protein